MININLTILLYVQAIATEQRNSASQEAYKNYKDEMEKVIAMQVIYILLLRKKKPENKNTRQQ